MGSLTRSISVKSFQVVCSRLCPKDEALVRGKLAEGIGRLSEIELSKKLNPGGRLQTGTILWGYPSRRGGGISGRLSITLSTKPKSLAISAVIK